MMINRIKTIVFCLLALSGLGKDVQAQDRNLLVLNPEIMRKEVSYFNSLDSEDVKNYISNADTYQWLSAQIPLFECPDSAIQKIYYYRWWTLRKQLKQTPNGYVFNEFITPMKHGGKYNAISSALGHQIYESRWLHDKAFAEKYVTFWLEEDKADKKPHLHNFSSWIDDAVYQLFLVNNDKHFLEKSLPALHLDYQLWETERRLPDHSFWQYDVKDAMEESISGSRKEKNVRPTINSYMYGNADALSKMARITGVDSLRKKYRAKAQELKKIVTEQLWDKDASFFKVKKQKGGFADAREAIGLIPWYFKLPPDRPAYAKAWEQLTDTTGFSAPWGLTTAERRHPLFRTHGSGHGCEWDGPVWPFATTQSLKALSNLLTSYKSHANMSPAVFYNEFHKYAMSHVMNGKTYIGEYQDEKTGEWLKGDNPRSRFYNHSGFTDLVISDLIGLKPREDQTVEIYPLIPENTWDWFCLDNVLYHGRHLTILWDKDGSKYGKGQGLRIYADGKQIGYAKKLTHLKAGII
ncbi:MAG: glycosyl hydrolase family 65 protein [Pedobacter sp.]|uniref:MGH1-like glycoside hydrolase domain-containing protein n=1 Tax=Pedobacter sp. TaxID=1411316 RepID=UPI003391B4CC